MYRFSIGVQFLFDNQDNRIPLCLSLCNIPPTLSNKQSEFLSNTEQANQVKYEKCKAINTDP